jgi:hypothetical protein
VAKLLAHVEVFATEEGVAIGRLHLEDAVTDLKNRNIEGFSHSGGVLPHRPCYFDRSRTEGILDPALGSRPRVDRERLQVRHKGGGHSQLSVSSGVLMSNTEALACIAGLIRREGPLIGTEAISRQWVAVELTSQQLFARLPGLKQNRLREVPLILRVAREFRHPVSRTLFSQVRSISSAAKSFSHGFADRAHDSQVSLDSRSISRGFLKRCMHGVSRLIDSSGFNL